MRLNVSMFAVVALAVALAQDASLARSFVEPRGPGGQAPASSSPSLSIDDVLEMVDVKLSEDLIISQIRKNGKPFALSTQDMIRLKTRGASDNVIRALIQPQPTAANSETTSGKPLSTGALPAPSAPSAYGYYILDVDKLSPLGQVPVSTTFGLTLADRGFAVDGLSGQEAILMVGAPSPTIIVYEQNVVIGSLQLAALSFVSSMKAYEFNIGNTAPQFFANVYRKNPNETIPIGLWRPSRTVQTRIEPVDGRTGMYRLVPVEQLAPGRYALYFPDSLHPGDTVFSASVGRRAAAFAFEVVRGAGGSTSDGIAGRGSNGAGMTPPEDVTSMPVDGEKTASGLVTKVLRVGTGSEHPKRDSTVTVTQEPLRHDGRLFEARPVGPPGTFKISQTDPGKAEGLQLMVVGEKRRMWIPAALGTKSGPLQGMWVIDVELLAFR